MSLFLEYNLKNYQQIKNQIQCNKKDLCKRGKKRIAYISSEWFIDTDLTILPYLASSYDLYWFHQTKLANPRFPLDKIKTIAKDNGINLIIFDSSPYKYQDLRNYFYYRKVVRLIKSINFDLAYRVSVDFFYELATWGLLPKDKIIYGVHDCIIHSGQRGRLMLQLASDFTIKLSKNFCVYSNTQLDLFKQRFPRKNIRMVGMSIKDFGVPTQECPPISKGVKLLFFGLIQSYKGLDILIKELESLYNEGYSNLFLSICGNGRYWERCKLLIKHKDKYNLTIRFIENVEIPNLMNTHHFLVLPYRDSTQSGPIMIAANYGLPIICPNLKAFLSIYDNKSAIVYPQGHLKEALIKASCMNETQYLELKKHVTPIATTFSSEAIAKNYISFFDRVMGV